MLKALAYAMKRCLGSHAWVFDVQPSLIGCACDATLSQLHPSPTGAYPILTFGHTLVHTLSATGGVVVISHHAEFTSAICSETWHVANGQLTITKKSADDEGEAEADGEAAHA